MRKEIDLSTVFLYPILPEPRCFVHPNGSLGERKKASLLHLMKGSINSSISGHFKLVIPDGMFITQTSVKDKTPTFTAFARSVFKGFETYKICFGLYESPSIKYILNANQNKMRILKRILNLDPVNASQATLINC